MGKKKKSKAKSVVNVINPSQYNITREQSSLFFSYIKTNNVKGVKKFLGQKDHQVINELTITVSLSNNKLGSATETIENFSPLAYAIMMNSSAIVKILAALAGKDNINKKSQLLGKRISCLQMACIVAAGTRDKNILTMQEEIINTLIDHGGNVNEIITIELNNEEENGTLKKEFVNVISYAVAMNFTVLFEKLVKHPELQKDQCFEYKTNVRCNTLSYLTQYNIDNNNNKFAINALLEFAKLKPSFEAIAVGIFPPEFIAIQERSLKILKMLIKLCGGDINRKGLFYTKDNMTIEVSLLKFAIIYEADKDIIQFLIAEFAKNKLLDNVEKVLIKNRLKEQYVDANYIMMLCLCGYDSEIVETMIAYGLNPLYQSAVKPKNKRQTFNTKLINKQHFFSSEVGFLVGSVTKKEIFAYSAYRFLIEDGNIENIKHFFAVLKQHLTDKSDHKKWHSILQESFEILVFNSEYYDVSTANHEQKESNKRLETIFDFLIEQGLSFNKELNTGYSYNNPLFSLITTSWPTNMLDKLLEVTALTNLSPSLEKQPSDFFHLFQINDPYLQWMIDRGFLNSENYLFFVGLLEYFMLNNKVDSFKKIIHHWHNDELTHLSYIFSAIATIKESGALVFAQSILAKQYKVDATNLEVAIAFGNESLLLLLKDKNLLDLNLCCHYGPFQDFPLYMMFFLDNTGKTLELMLRLGLDLDVHFTHPRTKEVFSLWNFALKTNVSPILLPMLKTKGVSDEVLSLVKQGFSPLFAAVVADDVPLVKFLLAHNDDPQKPEKITVGYEKNALRQATKNDNFEIVNRFLALNNPMEPSETLKLSSLIIDNRIPTYDVVSTMKRSSFVERETFLRLLQKNKQRLLKTSAIDERHFLLIETLNVLDYFSNTKNNPISGINFRITLSLFLHYYNNLDEKAWHSLQDDLIRKIVAPVIESLARSSAVDIVRCNNDLKHFCQNYRGKTEASDCLDTLTTCFNHFHDLSRVINDSTILYTNDSLFIRAKLLLIKIGDWVQKNKAILYHDDLSFEKDFLQSCKLIRDYASHEQFSLENILKSVDPFFIFQVIKYGKDIDLVNMYEKKQALFDTVLNERLNKTMVRVSQARP